MVMMAGELTMQKVKVTRYVSGRRPDYAPSESDSESSDDEDDLPGEGEEEEEELGEPYDHGEDSDDMTDANDRRLLRLRDRQSEDMGRR